MIQLRHVVLDRLIYFYEVTTNQFTVPYRTLAVDYIFFFVKRQRKPLKYLKNTVVLLLKLKQLTNNVHCTYYIVTAHYLYPMPHGH